MKILFILSLVLGFVCCAMVVLAEEESADEESAKHPLSVKDLWDMKRIGAPTVSPDGSLVVFPTTVFSKEDNKGDRDLWIVPTDGSRPPRRLTWSEGSDGSPAWSPDGKHLAFVSKRGEGPPQLYLLPVEEFGEAEPLTALPVAVQGPQWLPGGDGLVFAADTFPDLGDDFEKLKERLDAQKDDKTKAKISDRRLLRYWDAYRTDGTVPHLFHLDLKTREVRDLMPGYDRLMGFGSFDWDLSPEGTEIAFAANSTDPPWQTLDFNIFLLNIESGEIRSITTENPAEDGSPQYSPEGRFLYFGRTLRPSISPDFTRVARYDRESGKIAEVLPHWDGQPSNWAFSADGATLFFHDQVRGRRNLYAVATHGGTPQLLVEGGSTANVAVAGDRLVYLEQSFHRPPELVSVRSDGSASRRLTGLNDEVLAKVEFGTVEDVTFKGAGGDDVQMFVLKPPGFGENPEKKWPLLMLVHGGPHGAWLDSFHFRWNAALFGSPGYVVAALNFHGSTGFGQAYAESILGNHADKPFEDVMKATDHLLATEPIEASRMAVCGGSYGGYLASWILGHSNRFAAIINHAGVYDLMAQFASDYTWSRSNNYGAAPWENPDRIDLYSPSRFAENFETPTLILHGERDYRVPYTQGVNLHHVLTGKGVPSRIVVFPDENHWILKPQSAELWWQEVHAWLEKYIGEGSFDE
jgi:dipeptidyl aminopeptidase/acylaminoacyl peptidase